MIYDERLDTITLNKKIIRSPFSGFWMAGYECSDKLNAFGNRVDFLNITGHIDAVYKDYAMLNDFNISTVREGIRWSFVERQPYVYDFSVVKHMIEAAKIYNIQQVWDLCHFGYPDDLSPLHPMFARRFVALCKAFVEFYRSLNPSGILIIIPVNEVSFISWLGGDACGTTPYCKGSGWHVKYNLMKAYIEGASLLKYIDSNIKILSSEPLVNMVAANNATEQEITEAKNQHQYQFQSTDILCGNICPELKGNPNLVDYIGVNYYYNNQWVTGTFDFLIWKDEIKDVRWRPLSHLINEVYKRYGKPVVITETSHPKEDRPLWISDISTEIITILNDDIPLLGVCIYPIIDRPDWNDLITWHQAGLWDVVNEDGKLKRVLYKPFAKALLDAQQSVNSVIPKRFNTTFN